MLLLEKAGLKAITQNFRCRLGELDLVMAQGEQLVFVEVRYRRRDDWGSAAESISAAKMQKLARTAQIFLANHPEWQRAPCRFDSVCFRGSLDPDQANWQKDIFQID